MTSPARMYSLQRRTASRNCASVNEHSRLAGRGFLLRKSLVGQWSGETGTQVLEPRFCVAHGIGLARIGIDHEVKLAEHVVHHRELVGDEQQHVGRAERIGFSSLERFFDMANRLVAEVAGEAAAEAQRRRHGSDAVAREPGARTRTRRPRRFPRQTSAPRASRSSRRTVRPRASMRSAHGKADEGVAPEALAADHRLEQIGVRRIRELEVDRERRVQIRPRLRDDGTRV